MGLCSEGDFHLVVSLGKRADRDHSDVASPSGLFEFDGGTLLLHIDEETDPSFPHRVWREWHRERLSFSISGSGGLICSATTDSARFGFGRDIPPGDYAFAVSRDGGGGGATVAIAGENPVHITGWQVYSRSYVGLLVLSGIWAFAARRSGNLRHRRTSAVTFQHLLLGFVLGFSYLLFHEGGHALGEIAFGRFDLAQSDFWGLRGHPHSGGTSGPPLEPWQGSVISGGGPMLPTFAGWALFLLCGSRIGRSFRGARPMLNLYLLAIAAILIVPWFTTAGVLVGVLGEDGDWRGFLEGVPGPPWVIEGLLWGALVVNAIVLIRITPELWGAWKKKYLAPQPPRPTFSPGTSPSNSLHPGYSSPSSRS